MTTPSDSEKLEPCPWTEWSGGENPVPGQMIVALTRIGNETTARLSDSLYWTHHEEDENDIVAYRVVVRATDSGSLSPASVAKVDGRRFRHLKRGSIYEHVGVGIVQGTLTDDDAVVIYRGEDDGRLWVRGAVEFWDGRFEEIQPLPPANSKEPG